MQLYETISLTNAWWNTCCPDCGVPMADNPYRDVKITWSEILGIAIDLWGKPDGFFVRDFLISLEFQKGQIVLTFCSQGSRRGEVQVSVPASQDASDILKPFLDRVREEVEAALDEGCDTLLEGDYPQDYYEEELPF